MQKLLLLFLLLYALLPGAQAQTAASPADTLHLSLEEAEKLFVARNLPLLAQKAAIEASKAAVIQARLFENPELGLEQIIYNPTNGRYFDMSKAGQNAVTLEQLFYLAGKRNKRIKVEQFNSQLTEHEYADLLRTLRYDLRTSFLQLHFLRQHYSVLQERTKNVQQLVNAFNEQYRKGNVPLKEITRLKALLFSLENQQLALAAEMQQEQADLRLLTQTPATTTLVPEVDDTALDNVKSEHLSYTQLLETALEHRHDLKAAETNVKLQQANLTLQKALAVPDITVGGLYDKQSSIVRDYVGITLSTTLPLFNRNQGNIKAARSQMEQSQLLYTNQQQVVENEVMQAFQKAREAEQLYANFDPNFTGEFNRLIEGITSSFARRHISLIEFLDYYETYTDTMALLLELRSNRLQALEEINFVVGTPLIHY
ncbi:MAG TPA: TolC family protein [Pontibacter sp.]